jgi:hypothetical protein
MSRLSLALLVVVVACGPLGVATATGQQAPTLTVADAAIEPGETVTHDLTLDRVPAGLAGFEVTLRLAGDDAATVEGAAYPPTFRPTTTPRVGPSNRTITLEAADLQRAIEPGATDVQLATVRVNGTTTGRATLTVANAQIDADDGSRVDPTIKPGAIAVGVAPATETTTTDRTTTDRTGSDASGGANDPPTETVPPTDTTTGAGPGFGVLVAVLAAAAVAALVRRT